MTRPVVLSVAGSDPSGGAGLQADLKVAAAYGVHGAAVPTLLTVQDSRGVREVVSLEAGVFRRSLDVVLADLRPRAVKIGALASAEVIASLAAALAATDAPVILDTIVASSSGAPFLDEAALSVFARELVPRAVLLTPNLVEARLLLGAQEDDASALADASFRRFGVPTLVKGGHAEGDRSIDVLVDGEGEARFDAPRFDGPSPHGTGCALSMAIACELALGGPLREAIRDAKSYVSRAIARAERLGEGAPFLDFQASDERG
ncbi:MAG: bifunctional hydroxymethylpyrimidine kinase/phosphomethylpyrimidine kinase [Myxococcales bacterium]|nr:bifunctional hydroxymethylpyrimidine kinase/phosphomethylpyrimidine kinase [Myxococcales bacterium]